MRIRLPEGTIDIMGQEGQMRTTTEMKRRLRAAGRRKISGH
jgi:cell division protein ZapA (FtsZ GTPase activity inhibitor)